MRLTHVLAPANFGGLERVVFALSTGQQRRGNAVHVVMLVEAGTAEPFVATQLKHEEVEVVTIPTRRRDYLTQMRLLSDHCRETEPDVLHTHGYLPDVLSRALPRSVTARRVSTVHGFIGGTLRGRVYEWLQCRAYGRVDAVAVSRKLASDLVARGVPKTKVHLIPNGAVPVALLDRKVARQQLGLSEETFNVGWVGRVSHEKGLDVLLDALRQLTDLPIRLTVVGDGPSRAALQRYCEGSGLNSAVHWAGVLFDPSAMLRAFDLVVISSRTEGTPMTLLEAMSAQVPVVATAVGGIPDVMAAEQGLLVPSEDPGALTAAIRSVYYDRTAAMRRAFAARRRIDTDFSMENWLEQYDTLYAALPAWSGGSR